MTLKRREVLQAGAAMFGGWMLQAAAARAQGLSSGSAAYEFMVKDIVHQRNGGKVVWRGFINRPALDPSRRFSRCTAAHGTTRTAPTDSTSLWIGERRHRRALHRLSQCT